MRGKQFKGGGRALGVLPGRTALASAAMVLALSACGGSSGQHASYTTLVAGGMKQLNGGDPAAATRSFRQAIVRKKKSPVAYYDLGVIYQRQGKIQQAKREYFLALHYDPRYVPALYNQAGLFAHTFPGLSMAYYRRIVRLQPRSPTAYLNLGLLEAASGAGRARKRALRDLAQAVKLDPSLRAHVPAPLRGSLPATKKG